MASAAFLFVKTLLAVALYGVVFYHYVPSDITQAEWVYKPGVVFIFFRIFGLFVFYRMIRFIFFSAGQTFFQRVFSALFALPVYAFLTLLLMFSINGYNDSHEKTARWQTNIIYFKNFKFACIIAGIDDAQLHYKKADADIVFVSGKFCSSLAQDHFTPNTLTPYTIDFSDGAFSIPYVTAVQKRQ